MSSVEKIRKFEKFLALAKSSLSEAGRTKEQIANIFEPIDAQLESLFRSQNMLHGIRVAQLGKNFAVQAGKPISDSLFEMYELANEEGKLMEDACLFYELWKTSSSAEHFRLKIQNSPLRTFSFGLSASRVIAFFSDVRDQFVSEGQDEITFPQSYTGFKEEL